MSDQPDESVPDHGVGSWGLNHYLLQARSELTRSRYDQVVVFFYLGNDIEKKKIDHFGPKRSEVRHHFRWPRQPTRREIVGGLLFPVNDYFETRSHLYLLVKNRLWFVLMRLGLSARYFPDVLLRDQAPTERWRVSADLSRSIADEATLRGIPTLFVLLPGICQVDRRIAEITARAVGLEIDKIDSDQPSRLMERELARHGLEVLDMTPTLRAAHTADRKDLYGRVDIHFDPGAHQLLADLLAPRLLASIPPYTKDRRAPSSSAGKVAR